MSEIRTPKKPFWNFNWVYNFNLRKISCEKLIDEHSFFSKSGKKIFKIGHKKFLNLDILMEINAESTNESEKAEIYFRVYEDEGYNLMENSAYLSRISISCYKGEFSVHIAEEPNANADALCIFPSIKPITQCSSF